MQDLHTRIARLKRPALLARAARFGVDDYRREVHLRRLLRMDPLPRPADALMRLLDMEQEVDNHRRAKDGTYMAAHHVDVLIAITGEARLLQATRPRLM
ncbi:DUF6477 family protein [Yoonia sp.]|uniref:DUF6477 family protein n=1 Tax=Yoonia sp. TaxID=2212373 RepID=UPI0019DDA6ED|nr:DUF6477 family protein [Yoonia sp.]MBE0413458.1 hypothetical protein [Yoonia sp.]